MSTSVVGLRVGISTAVPDRVLPWKGPPSTGDCSFAVANLCILGSEGVEVFKLGTLPDG